MSPVRLDARPGPVPTVGMAQDAPALHPRPYPASPANYGADRGGTRVDTIVLHTIEGSAMAGLSWFASRKATASAHYVVGKDGDLWLSVPESACAWHAGNRAVNLRSIGIECEGHHDQIETWTAPLLATLVDLLVELCRRYPAITPDRAHIIGHAEVPHPTRPGQFGGAGGHVDPGVLIPWDFIIGEVQRRLAPPPLEVA